MQDTQRAHSEKFKEFASAHDSSTRYKYTCGYFTEVLVKGPAEAVKPAGAAEEKGGAAEAAGAEEEHVEQEQHVLGITASTDLKADVGDVLMVKPIELVQNEDGSIVWILFLTLIA